MTQEKTRNPHLSVGDGAHERGLATAIVAADAIALATLEMEAGVVKENLRNEVESRL